MMRRILLGATSALICTVVPMTQGLAQTGSGSGSSSTTSDPATPSNSTATPSNSTATPSNSTSPQPASASAGSSTTEEKLQKLLNSLNLTPQQKKEVDGMKANAERQVRAIMTPEQLKQFDANISSGKQGAAAYDGLNLTDDQQQKLNGVQTIILNQLLAILTPEQLQTMMQQVK
jgi:Spy/CpxP family protein refolding chaperone